MTHTLELVMVASIVSITFLDHVLVSVDIDLLYPTSKPWAWKLNDSLLQIPEIMKEISSEMTLFFFTNVKPDSEPMMVWEAYKGYIRGILIKIGLRLKKEKTKQMVDLLGKIRAMEAFHKQSMASKTLADPVQCGVINCVP